MWELICNNAFMARLILPNSNLPAWALLRTVSAPIRSCKPPQPANTTTPPVLPCLPAHPQDIDFSVPRRQDEEQYDLDVGQRVYVSVPPERMMGFDYAEVDGSAVTA